MGPRREALLHLQPANARGNRLSNSDQSIIIHSASSIFFWGSASTGPSGCPHEHLSPLCCSPEAGQHHAGPVVAGVVLRETCLFPLESIVSLNFMKPVPISYLSKNRMT